MRALSEQEFELLLESALALPTARRLCEMGRIETRSDT
jgi:hypothetical protein